MELFPVRDVLGFPEILWSIRQWYKKRKSSRWARVAGIVEGHELLLANNNGWLAVFYSYDYQGQCFSGELRKWLCFVDHNSYEARTAEVTARIPRGMKIGVRVDAEQPASSMAEL